MVCVDEVVAALTVKERNLLEQTYSKDLSSLVAVILRLLLVRSVVFSPGKFGTRYYYGVASVLDPVTSPLPTEESRRRRVLELVRRTVMELGRAVRNIDVLEYAASTLDVGDLTPTLITRDILGLKESGELRLVGLVRGDGRGINLYLPTELNLKDYPAPAAPTWLEEVRHTFNEMWAERTAQAADNGKLRPLSTGEVRVRLRDSSRYPENFTDPMVFVNAMQQLAQTSNPVVRKVRRLNQRAMLWAPANLDDAQLDVGDAYASDVERISEAVRRAEHALTRPVTLHDVQDQVELDPSIQPSGTSSIFSILSDAAKEHVGVHKGVRNKRATQHVHRIGKIADTAYYATTKSPEAAAFVEFGRLELHWSGMRVSEQLETLAIISLPTVAVGRVMLASTEIAAVVRDLDQLRTEGLLHGAQRQRAAELSEHITEVDDAVRRWLDEHGAVGGNLPKSVATDVPTWTANELLEVIRPLYPRSQKLQRGSKLLPLLGDAIRRVRNPRYANRFSTDSRIASEYLFDRTDALIYAAKEWSGHECGLQATLAGNELGRLRDVRFVLPALDSKDFNVRLSVVSCLAFLSSDVGNNRLREVATNDPDPGVRQSALWAYGFAGATDVRELLDTRSKNDQDIRVRDFAREVLLNTQDSWWAM